MNDIKKLIELAEHPERFSEEQMTALLSDEESLKMFLTISETIAAMEQAEPKAEDPPHPTLRPTLHLRWIAAAAIALLTAIGILLQKPWETSTEPLVAEGETMQEQQPTATFEIVAPGSAQQNILAEGKQAGSKAKRKRRTKHDATPTCNEEETDALVERQLKLQQARIDNQIASVTAEIILAEYSYQQMAEGRSPELPPISPTLGDGSTPEANIMTLIML